MRVNVEKKVVPQLECVECASECSESLVNVKIVI